jgi:hypothetical protein
MTIESRIGAKKTKSNYLKTSNIVFLFVNRSFNALAIT